MGHHHTFLENCPFCNSVAEDKSSSLGGIFVESVRCSNRDCAASIKSTTVKAWNTRYEPVLEPAISSDIKVMQGTPEFLLAWSRVMKGYLKLATVSLANASSAMVELDGAVTDCNSIVKRTTAGK